MSIFMLWLLLVVLPGLKDVVIPIAILSGMAILVVSLTVNYDDGSMSEHTARKCWNVVRALVFTVFVCMVLTAILPSRSDVYTIAGAYLVTNVENIEKLPANVVTAANKLLEDYTSHDQK